MNRPLKKIDKRYKDESSSNPDSDFGSAETCSSLNHVCCVFLLILFLLATYDWILAEVTTPIRCAIAGDTTKVLMSVEEWQKQRGIEQLKPIKDEKEYSSLFKSGYQLTDLEKQTIPQVIKFNNRTYEFRRINLTSSIAFYTSEENYLDTWITYYWLIYDTKLQRALLSAKDVIGSYKILYAERGGIGCDVSNSHKLNLMSYQYNF
ncbi:hypothetical protein QV08_03680 [Gallibacterium salpingitidis]|uniref:Toxin co-regulated pilus biosynthesis protein Q C-terminal domain-containing protein n=1 Tax=Gallibacterium salpingitidis TaxID=505341 RepID=A0AB36E681_9PAST|nr:hypothetical protein [Gallibacterium salpingitidis]OBX08677.1 hypothetical protein QV08_03680 [Gallibacterium salpingitidis]OBX10399.1 hypothetical protein QV09_06095 [Gallibacterium salpingitidis]WKS99333.1 hypothetical protein NYR30_11500 [Gallibacterium salpingitidis]